MALSLVSVNCWYLILLLVIYGYCCRNVMEHWLHEINSSFMIYVILFSRKVYYYYCIDDYTLQYEHIPHTFLSIS